jgi:hypothetical protein
MCPHPVLREVWACVWVEFLTRCSEVVQAGLLGAVAMLAACEDVHPAHRRQFLDRAPSQFRVSARSLIYSGKSLLRGWCLFCRVPWRGRSWRSLLGRGGGGRAHVARACSWPLRPAAGRGARSGQAEGCGPSAAEAAHRRTGPRPEDALCSRAI